jgi:hypothetical protein
MWLSQVLHTAQLDDRKLLTSQVGQVDDMYESLAAHEQKVPMADQLKHDDLTEALAHFQTQLAEVGSQITGLHTWCKAGRCKVDVSQDDSPTGSTASITPPQGPLMHLCPACSSTCMSVSV